MILGYKKQFPWGKETEFKRKIQQGVKKHTIREDKCDRWHLGRKINHCHGVRTKFFENFYNINCTGTQKIQIIKHDHMLVIYIDDKLIGHYFPKPNCCDSHAIEQLALNDGFDCFGDFFKWFNKDFTGKIIHWTDLRY